MKKTEIYKIFEREKKESNYIVFLHDMLLPISPESMYDIMSNPENWAVVNFPIIKNVEILNSDINHKRFIISEKIIGSFYNSTINLSLKPDLKSISYYHESPTFPFIEEMASDWYFVKENTFCHFFILRRFKIKNWFYRTFLFWFIKIVINNHVDDYYKQLIALTKSLNLKK